MDSYWEVHFYRHWSYRRKTGFKLHEIVSTAFLPTDNHKITPITTRLTQKRNKDRNVWRMVDDDDRPTRNM